MDFLGPPEELGYILDKVNFSLVLRTIAQDAVTPHTMVTEKMNHEWKAVLLTEVLLTYSQRIIPVMEITVHQHIFTKALRVF